MALINMCFRANIQSPKGKKHTRKTEERIAELEEEYELDIYDRNDIREEEYQKGGWKHDPYPEELDEEEEEDEEEWHYMTMEQQLNEVGMSMRDFL